MMIGCFYRNRCPVRYRMFPILVEQKVRYALQEERPLKDSVLLFRFIARLSRVERLAAKLEIMSFMLTFYDLALAIRNVFCLPSTCPVCSSPHPVPLFLSSPRPFTSSPRLLHLVSTLLQLVLRRFTLFNVPPACPSSLHLVLRPHHDATPPFSPVAPPHLPSSSLLLSVLPSAHLVACLYPTTVSLLPSLLVPRFYCRLCSLSLHCLLSLSPYLCLFTLFSLCLLFHPV